jgi:hypothetical protein
MALSEHLQERIRAVAAELRYEVHGPRGCPEWGTTFDEMEQETGAIGDALACEMLSQELEHQAEAAGNTEGRCGGCGEPIPFDEIAGRLLQTRRGEAVWQESYGQCKRCRKAFFPSLPGVGHRAG